MIIKNINNIKMELRSRYKDWLKAEKMKEESKGNRSWVEVLDKSYIIFSSFLSSLNEENGKYKKKESKEVRKARAKEDYTNTMEIFVDGDTKPDYSKYNSDDSVDR